MVNKEYAKQWRKAHRDSVLESSRRYYQNHREEILKKDKRRWKENRIQLKREVLLHYSPKVNLVLEPTSQPFCVRCGFSDLRALSLDHIIAIGGRQKHELYGTKRGTEFYRWLRTNGYPEGLQVLCMNCQYIKRYENMEWKPIEKIREHPT